MKQTKFFTEQIKQLQIINRCYSESINRLFNPYTPNDDDLRFVNGYLEAAITQAESIIEIAKGQMKQNQDYFNEKQDELLQHFNSQIEECKKQYPGVLFIHRCKDFFYEAYKEDAEIIAGVIDRPVQDNPYFNCNFIAFPCHLLNEYLHKLVKAGHRVAISTDIREIKPNPYHQTEVA